MNKTFFQKIKTFDKVDFSLVEGNIVILQACNMTYRKKRYKIVRFNFNESRSLTLVCNNEDFLLRLEKDGEETITRNIGNYYIPSEIFRRTRTTNVLFASKEDKKEFYSYIKNRTTVNEAIHEVISPSLTKRAKKKEKERKKREKKKEDKMKEAFAGLHPLPRLKEGAYLPQYLFFSKKKGECFCTSCKKQIETPSFKLKNRTLEKCPVCKADIIMINEDIRKKEISDHNWVVVGDEGENQIVLRYILISRKGKEPERRAERARAVLPKILSEKMVVPYYELPWGENKWRNNGYSFFSTHHFYSENKWCCLNAVPHKSIAKIVSRLLPMFPKGWSTYESMNILDFFWMCRKEEYRNALEILLKQGFTNIANYYIGNSWTKPLGNRPHEIVSLSKEELRALGKNPKMWQVTATKNLRKIGVRWNSAEHKAIVDCFGEDILAYSINDFLAKKTIAKCNYVSRQEKNKSARKQFLAEWSHYIEVAQKMGYDTNSKSVLFPKDFRKEDKRISEEYEVFKKKMDERLKKELDSTYLATIQQLTKALRESDEIRNFMEGSKGLLIKVPETPEELFEEHKALNNCLNTYVKKVAAGETLIFFIRKIEEPDKAFVAMEYRDGRVIQVHNKNNGTPEQKIVDFCYAFGNILAAMNFNHHQFAAVA